MMRVVFVEEAEPLFFINEMNQQPTIDLESKEIRQRILPHCRLKTGQVWQDKVNGHVVGCGDATDLDFIQKLSKIRGGSATLAVHDPPYNLVMFKMRTVDEFISWSERWVNNTIDILADDASFYIWLGADQNNHFQPLPQFMELMSQTSLNSRSLITMRNQRGYGTQKNWMAVRQELLYYTKGNPTYDVQYTDIPKILRGYYKNIAGEKTENIQRSKSMFIRASNVWVDIQQVFYRMKENVSLCPAQKPLKSIERIILASSNKGGIVADFFSHAGTTLLACEMTGRKCLTLDIDPIFAEISIRRLEHFRKTGQPGWQRDNLFEKELGSLTKQVPLAATL